MDLYHFFIKPYENTSNFHIFLEFFASIFGVLSVIFSIKKKIWVYPFGIISTIIYIYLLFIAGLLGDCIINFYYTIMSIYGWILWKKNKDTHNEIIISFTNKKQWIFCLILFIVSSIFITIIYYFKPYIDNHFSTQGVDLGFHHLDWANVIDILTTALFLIGMWLMAKRKIENWIFWIIGDLISIPMYFHKGLGITSLQYLIFTIMAIIGYLKWRKTIKNSTKHNIF